MAIRVLSSETFIDDVHEHIVDEAIAKHDQPLVNLANTPGYRYADLAISWVPVPGGKTNRPWLIRFATLTCSIVPEAEPKPIIRFFTRTATIPSTGNIDHIRATVDDVDQEMSAITRRPNHTEVAYKPPILASIPGRPKLLRTATLVYAIGATESVLDITTGVAVTGNGYGEDEYDAAALLAMRREIGASMAAPADSYEGPHLAAASFTRRPQTLHTGTVVRRHSRLS